MRFSSETIKISGNSKYLIEKLYTHLVNDKNYAIILDSANCGRYDYLCWDPFLIFKSFDNNILIKKKNFEKIYKRDPFNFLELIFKDHKIKRSSDLPLFFGGAVGYIGYDNAQFIENIKLPKRFLNIPDIFLIFPQKIICIDHVEKNLFFFDYTSQNNELNKIKDIISIEEKEDNYYQHSIDPIAYLSEFESNINLVQYIKKIDKAMQYIRAGDSYQIKICQRLSKEFRGNAFNLFKILKRINPSPYSAFLNLRDFHLVSCSPEHLIKLENNLAETRPIGGTYPYTKDKDEEIIKKFIADEKEKAEHTMLIDMERNDLGRVCEFGSTHVSELMTVEKYSHLVHLVTNIKGKLRNDKTCFDLFKSMFPGGTITGCPKVRTMEIISELENERRGPYTGSIGFFNYNEEMDFNILIRAAILKDNYAYIHVGGGIVADSNPEREYYETIDKAKALMLALKNVT
jgi:anthranilate/para-aminobenzoate synthase component I